MKAATVYIDGAARGNPGPAGIGVYIVDGNEQPLEEYCFYLGDSFTNNFAEYQALLHALRLAEKHATTLEVYSDSQLLVRQMTGVYRVKHPEIKKLYGQAQQLLKSFAEVNFHHIKREFNKVADGLANKAIDTKEA